MLTSTSKRTPVALWVWYLGGSFRGFQRQPQGPTVQEALEGALRAVGVPATVMPAGRTDRGVHARMQVVSVRLEAGDSAEALAQRLPAHLPPGLGLCLVRKPRSFHAQWSASGKAYRYRFHLGGSVAPEWAPYSLDVANEAGLQGQGHRVTPERVASLLALAAGTRDFIAFHEKSSPQKPRTLESATVHEHGGGLYEARLNGDGFARYQVRYVVGGALKVAAGLLPEEAWRSALETGAAMEGFKAPAHGLMLWEVRYPPDVDPFTAPERLQPPGLPREPPFLPG
ncbi:tRNA pseudouridine synthase A [Myxococcus landrumensis]|uniref:tRNA pseudouridine synthase A n=1 Tax=Myxococcus landrumensis TaxID=2813577 RepID=A0ABX7NE19_9BACT|nr:tRNA pseudouridine(38-40) synthase TruA [Myxococcus landrumus]QSQ15850.1 tRNA pseudouridine(38-40) synthase TruA [Myxococcus landrumus]